jgi:acyl-CoA thioester hydrolase
MKTFSSKYNIYYEDTDAGGVVYYANYLKFFERARTDLLQSHDIFQSKIKQYYQALFVVRKCDVLYKNPARFEDKIIINTQILKIGRSYIDFKQIMQLEDNQRIISEANINIACVDCLSMKPKRIPKLIEKTFCF